MLYDLIISVIKQVFFLGASKVDHFNIFVSLSLMKLFVAKSGLIIF